MSPKQMTSLSKLLCHPPSFHPAIQKLSWPQKATAATGVRTPSLICVFSVIAVTDDGPAAFEADTVSGWDKVSP